MTAQGGREVLGIDVGDSEAETFWTPFMRSLNSPVCWPIARGAGMNDDAIERYLDDLFLDLWRVTHATRARSWQKPKNTFATLRRPRSGMAWELPQRGWLLSSPGCQ